MLRNDISLLQIMLFCCKICFVAIYAVLSRNLFCRDLRAFVWRKVEPKIMLVEKKRQISGMILTRVQNGDVMAPLHMFFTQDYVWRPCIPAGV